MEFYPIYCPKGRAKDIEEALAKNGYRCGNHRAVNSVEQAQVIFVFGGDGTIMETIHKYYIPGKIFIAANRGTRGFLANHLPVGDLDRLAVILDDYVRWTVLDLNLMMVRLKKESSVWAGEYDNFVAFNDVYVNAYPGTSVTGTIEGTHYPKKKFIGDGIIVCTPQGSTAYNHSAGGSILAFYPIFGITSICSRLMPIRDSPDQQRLVIKIEKGEVKIHADNVCLRSTKEIIIEPLNSTVRLAFHPDTDFRRNRYL